jgi:hypothetical protein
MSIAFGFMYALVVGLFFLLMIIFGWWLGAHGAPRHHPGSHLPPAPRRSMPLGSDESSRIRPV